MKYLINTILFLAIIATIFVACTESEPVDISGVTKIYPLANANTYYGDTLIIYGEYIGKIQDSSYLLLNDTLRILSANCIQWTDSKIMFEMPSLPPITKVVVVTNGHKNEPIVINIAPLPSFASVKINKNSFKMGSSFGYKDEEPIHDVTLTNDLLVSSSEINQRLYELVTGKNPSILKYSELPVYNITWLDAIKFCNAVSQYYSLKPVYTILESYISWDTTANGWRLPTEAEWEFIAQIDDSSASFVLDDYAWYSMNSGENPQPCATKQPNENGLYDVLGNVAEWCWDYYQADYYISSPVMNPIGPIDGTKRVMRGGSCYDGKAIIRTQKRNTGIDNTFIGIRLVRSDK